MRRKLLLVLAVLSLLVGLSVAAAESASAALGDLYGCTPYATLASISSSGHRLSTQGTVCLRYMGGSTTNNWLDWEVVARFKCYRDGVLFGDGTGGCRWDGHLRLAESDSPTKDEYFAWPGSGSSSFYPDSGRIYGAYSSHIPDNSIQGCVRSGRVHFMGITGIDYGTYNMADMCTPWRKASDY